MSCSTRNPAVVTPVLAAGSTASPYFYQVNISQSLCRCACASRVPVFNPTVSLVSFSAVGTNQYAAVVHLEGIVSYNPTGQCACCSCSQIISQDFTIPFASATAPTSVTIEAGTPVNQVVALACENTSRSFVSALPLTLTVG